MHTLSTHATHIPATAAQVSGAPPAAAASAAARVDRTSGAYSNIEGIFRRPWPENRGWVLIPAEVKKAEIREGSLRMRKAERIVSGPEPSKKRLGVRARQRVSREGSGTARLYPGTQSLSGYPIPTRVPIPCPSNRPRPSSLCSVVRGCLSTSLPLASWRSRYTRLLYDS